MGSNTGRPGTGCHESSGGSRHAAQNCTAGSAVIPSQPVPRYWSAICSHSTSVRRRCRSGLVVLAGDDDAGHDGRVGVVAHAMPSGLGPEADRPHAGVTLGDHDAVGQAAERDVAAVQFGADVEHEVSEPAG
jgi:hypothetical protein